jgi:hypothetical protein
MKRDVVETACLVVSTVAAVAVAGLIFYDRFR